MLLPVGYVDEASHEFQVVNLSEGQRDILMLTRLTQLETSWTRTCSIWSENT